jgi:hypothetical protein
VVTGTNASVSAIAGSRLLANICPSSTAPAIFILRNEKSDSICGMNEGPVASCGWDRTEPTSVQID